MDTLAKWLSEQTRDGKHRSLTPIKRLSPGFLQSTTTEFSAPLLDFSSNDYLALSQHPEMVMAGHRCLDTYGCGVGGARLMSGDLELFHELEDRVARFKTREAALVFGSGYLGNLGVISSLTGRGDVIFSDRLNHASIHDGCRLSGAGLVRFRHNDPDHLEDCLKKKRGKGRALIVVESIYSMDGDRCPLPELVVLKQRYDTLLMVDEAHATGIFGSNGGGVIQEDGVSEQVDVAFGTFGKALGSYGAYVAGSPILKDFLINRARSFIFSTGLPPAVIGCSLTALKIVEENPGMGKKLLEKAAFFRMCLCQAGLPGELTGASQIIPILVGDSDAAVALADECRRNGVFATAVRPPTVPVGAARLRFSISLAHTSENLREAAGVLAESSRKIGVRVRVL
ncbi:MAG: 8-amino-7-oxononanoate synthase [Proteobacteria bacterium]|nr:8-amino-7-oxononanoate synthase [Pseudomonadota bacterium]MBU1687028.1 8-amino-7-oxononanoate synthase [Pseudomonadota bacterium]